MSDNWHRIEKIVKWTGLSVNAFAREIGLNRAENLYQIKRGNNGISRDLAELICEKYALVSKAWLLTGEGEMFLEKPPMPAGIPFYRMEAVSLITAAAAPQPESEIVLPMMPECDFAAYTRGKAMQPSIPPGSIIMCRRVDPPTFIPGGEYLIKSAAFTGIRSLRRDRGSENVRLVPANKEEFDEIMLPVNEITELYSIVGVIIDKTMQ